MNSTDDGVNGLLEAVPAQLNAVINYIPTILVVILVLTIGWIVARLARRVVRRVGTSSNRWLTRVFPSGIFSGVRMSSLAVTFLGAVVFWAIILIAVTIAAKFAELGSVSQWLDGITAQLPNFVAGVGIVIAGYFLSVFVREFLQTETATELSSTSSFIGGIAQAAIVSLAVIIGLDQVGVEVALLIGLAVVITAGIVTALAVAFASGARSHISNLIGSRTAQTNLNAGMAIQVGDIHGEIIEITSTLIALDTDAGRVLVPGKLADEMVITVTSPVSSQEARND